LRVKAAGITDVGLKRKGNEDHFSAEDALGLYVVADGMGGHLAGEVASRIAVDMINKSLRRWMLEEIPQDELFGSTDGSLSPSGNYVCSAIRLANRVLFELAMEYTQYNGMGTTVAILLVTPNLLVAANVGDSRIYMIRNGHLERLSKDHTIVTEQVEMGIMTEEEAASSPLKHILTRNLGSAENVEADIYELVPSNNDRFMLCSDGLTDLVSDEEILEIAQGETDPAQLCHRLVEKVLKRGAHDNTTVISVFLTDMERPSPGPLRKIEFFLADLLLNIQKMIKKFKP
jgi:protein phosphatase